jgi:hypothetical protein
VIARLAVTLAILGCASVARADDHPRVQLEIDPCVEAPTDEVRRVVSIELGALLTAASDASSDRTRATVDCEGGLARFRVDDPITGKSLSRTIDLGSAAPKARTRLIALAVVELISASWTELDVNPEPRVLPSGPRPSAEARNAALATLRARVDRRADGELRLEALAGGMEFGSGTGLLVGGGLRVVGDRSDSVLGWAIDAQAHHGTSSVSLGRVSADVTTIGAAVDAHQTWSRWTLRLGAGVRGGEVRLSGVPDPAMGAQGKTFWAPWIGPLARGDVELVVARRLVLDVGAEGGYVVSPVGGLVGDRREVAIDGAWIGVHVGAGMSL